jgi:biotin-dependent carboxylase-like uncharacterized protein
MSSLKVINPGMHATIQDTGRHGYQRFGISESGAMDRFALGLANRLVGNAPGLAAVEMTLIGGSYTCQAESCRLAVAGFDAPMALDDAPVPPYAALTLRRGSTLKIGRARTGARGYLAVAGGLAVEPMLGSCSTHVRSGLGGLNGSPLRAGDEIPLVCADAQEGAALALARRDWPNYDGAIRIVFGPQADYFDTNAKVALLTSTYTLDAHCDRMAYNLLGPKIPHVGDYNIVSDAITNGSIQIAGTQLPTILLADRQTTGGYPKIATVASADLPRIAQLRAGDTLNFESLEVDAAEALARRASGALNRVMARTVPSAYCVGLSSERLLSTNLISGIVADDT